MNILVVDAAADKGGAVSILNEYYRKACEDKLNNYFFCVSIPELSDTINVNILKFPWVKKSWFHRLWFDNLTVKRIIRVKKIDSVLSLQNTLVATNLKQKVYLHQSLPFSSYRFKIIEDPKLWVYQNIIYIFIRKAVKCADRVIVQTEWMRTAVSEKCGVNKNKITVEFPEFNYTPTAFFNDSASCRKFVYPAAGYKYKNHITLFKAIEILKQQGISDFRVSLTLEAKDLDKECGVMLQSISDVIDFIGVVPGEKLKEIYAVSILVFPSYIETIGLPLLEARKTMCPIIASDMLFSREMLDGYERAEFFKYDDYIGLAELMKKYL